MSGCLALYHETGTSITLSLLARKWSLLHVRLPHDMVQVFFFFFSRSTDRVRFIFSGHNFGFPHSSSFECADASGRRVSTYSQGVNCQKNEYGDTFSTMGSWCGVNYHGKDRLAAGWLDTSAVATLASSTASSRYTIGSVDSFTPVVPTRMVRVPLRKPIVMDGKDLDGGYASWYYYVEFRSGYQNLCTNLNSGPALIIRLAPNPTSGANSLAIDSRPDTQTMDDAPIYQAGYVFNDTFQGISIRVVSINANQAVIDVVLDQTIQNQLPGSYFIMAKHSGRVLDVFGGSVDALAQVIQFDPLNGQNQNWSPLVNTDGTWSFVAKHSNMCLDIATQQNGGERSRLHTIDRFFCFCFFFLPTLLHCLSFASNPLIFFLSTP
jgi:hypothetical protein